jgi:hypothetical protein
MRYQTFTLPHKIRTLTGRIAIPLIGTAMCFILLLTLCSQAKAQDCAPTGPDGQQLVGIQPQIEPNQLNPVNLTGAYLGVAVQEGTIFGYSMSLLQSGTRVAGLSCTWIPDSPYYALYSVSGQVQNGVFDFTEVTIIRQNSSGFNWCLKTGDLTIFQNGLFLGGPWTAPGCNPGTIAIYRVIK